MSEHKKSPIFCEGNAFSLDILFYRQGDAFGILPPQSGGIRMDNDLAVFFQEDTIQSF